ncbi:hypothetical protein KDA11_04070, partial [Candidatus Saccharibacteria bacterium]|nr:hypothetical protein [Candidatus Saccharibacteria bacterium]
TFSLMVALAWNDLAQTFKDSFGKNKSMLIYFIYAVIVSIAAIVILWSLNPKKGDILNGDAPQEIEAEV